MASSADIASSMATSGVGSKNTTVQAVSPGELLTLAADNAALKVPQDPFWPQPVFDILKWDRLFPYQLMVVKAETDELGNLGYTPVSNACFTFPFPPESLTVSTPFAINTTVTLGGIVEEHNAFPLKMFSFRGTMGHLPKRDTLAGGGALSKASSFAGGVVQGTISQAAGTLADLSNLGATLGISSASANVHLNSDFTGKNVLSKTTGYYQIDKLREFLETYATIKKTSKGRDLRLALAVWKDSDKVHLVTPVTFNVSKDASSPLEYKYSLDFKAWKRVLLKPSLSGFKQAQPVRTNVLLLQKTLNVLTQARKVIRDIGQIPQAFLGDLNRINEVFRQSIGFCKDLAGTTQNLADLPESIKSQIVKAAREDGSDFKTAGKQIAKSVSNFQKNILQPFAYSSGSKSILKSSDTVEEISGALEDTSLDQFNSVISPKLRESIVSDINKTRQLTRSDFERMRDDMSAFANKMAFLLGAGNDTFKNTYGLGDIVPLKNEPTASDWDLLYSLNDSVMALDSLAATGAGEPSEPTRLVDVMAQLARGAGIAFKVPVSKFAVPFPYGATLESLAAKYLGDPNRSIEIAALNGLKEPYVDETGFDLNLLVNGAGNQILVSDNQNLFVGQRVSIGSNGAQRVYRYIANIKKDLNSHLLITLDGEPDLSRFKVADRAFLHAYLPDTINSESLIYIPSDQEPIENDYLTKDIPGVSTIDPMVVVGGVDLLLDSDRNLVITPDGDCKYAVGLTNIIQSAEIAFSVPRGKLLLHPNFGLLVQVGSSMADVSAASVLNAVKEMFASDPSFASVSSVSINQREAALSIDASVVVVGSSAPLPLSFGIK